MPDIASRTLFSGGNDICPNDLGNAEVSNFSTDIDARLHDVYKWKEKAIGVVGLTLSSDNERVSGGQFITRGTTGMKESRYKCSHIWENATPDNILIVNFPTLDIFTFEEGGLWSSIVPSNAIPHLFHDKHSNVVLAEERTRACIGDFSARIVCQVSSSSEGRKGVIVKYNILLFPASQHMLAEIPESKYVGWPGLACHEGSFPMGPRPTVSWKCPIVCSSGWECLSLSCRWPLPREGYASTRWPS
jgi:hypothetical protein